MVWSLKRAVNVLICLTGHFNTQLICRIRNNETSEQIQTTHVREKEENTAILFISNSKTRWSPRLPSQDPPRAWKPSPLVWLILLCEVKEIVSLREEDLERGLAEWQQFPWLGNKGALESDRPTTERPAWWRRQTAGW